MMHHITSTESQVMPDVMTPDSMVAKLDEFEAMAEDTVTQEERDVSLHKTV